MSAGSYKFVLYCERLYYLFTAKELCGLRLLNNVCFGYNLEECKNSNIRTDKHVYLKN